MYRGVILGGLAFGAVFALERVFSNMAADLARYDKLRKMSGQEPVLREVLRYFSGAVGEQGANTGGFIAGLGNDVIRYAKMKGM